MAFCMKLLKGVEGVGIDATAPLVLTRKVDVRLPGNGNANSHGARPVHLIITMIKWIRTSRLSIKNPLYAASEGRGGRGGRRDRAACAGRLCSRLDWCSLATLLIKREKLTNGSKNDPFSALIWTGLTLPPLFALQSLSRSRFLSLSLSLLLSLALSRSRSRALSLAVFLPLSFSLPLSLSLSLSLSVSEKLSL